MENNKNNNNSSNSLVFGRWPQTKMHSLVSSCFWLDPEQVRGTEVAFELLTRQPRVPISMPPIVLVTFLRAALLGTNCATKKQ